MIRISIVPYPYQLINGSSQLSPLKQPVPVKTHPIIGY